MAKNKKTAPQINQAYIDEYYKNEWDANKHMSIAAALTAIIIAILWIGYLTPIFNVNAANHLLINITFPINIVLLLTPLIWIRTKGASRPGYKYFIVIAFILVIANANVVTPKHTMIAWVIPIILANHYYNPKFGFFVFITVITLMIICIYGAMFFGEFAPDYMTGEIMAELDDTIRSSHPALAGKGYPDTIEGRYEFLNDLMKAGDNRYIKVFAFYYIPRLAMVSIIFFISNQLNKRTYKLLISEVRVNTEQQRVAADLSIAKEIQLSNLPKEIIQDKTIQLVGELDAAKEVGGDFYDYKYLDDKHLALIIGDVSGKGIPAAMFMMKTITCFKAYADINKTPSQILKDINRTIFDGNTNQMFVTCFLAILNLETGEMKYANAGHNPPVIGKNKDFHFLKCNSGFVLGGLKDAFVADEETIIEPGQILMMYTDGVTEARNKDGGFYGETRLLESFNRKEYSSLIELRHSVKDDIVKFVDDAEQSDDLTYLAMQYKGDDIDIQEILLDASKDNTNELLDFIKKFAKKHEFQESFINNLVVVGDELISNIIKYGYKDSEGKIFIRNTFNKDKKEYTFTIIDNGVPFNPFEVEEHQLEGEAKDKKEGGLGILLVKKIMDDYFYEYINQKNIIMLKKRI